MPYHCGPRNATPASVRHTRLATHHASRYTSRVPIRRTLPDSLRAFRYATNAIRYKCDTLQMRYATHAIRYTRRDRPHASRYATRVPIRLASTDSLRAIRNRSPPARAGGTAGDPPSHFRYESIDRTKNAKPRRSGTSLPGIGTAHRPLPIRSGCRGVFGRDRGLGVLVVNGFVGSRGRLSPNSPPSHRLAPVGFYEKGTGSERSEVPVPFFKRPAVGPGDPKDRLVVIADWACW